MAWTKLKRCLILTTLILPIAGFSKEDASTVLARCKAQAELMQARGPAVKALLIKCMSAKGFVLVENLPISKNLKCSETIYPEESAECYRRTTR